MDHTQICTQVSWIAFNVGLIVFFGVLHQGGVTPVLTTYVGPAVALGDGECGLRLATGDCAEFVAFHKTYMPPRYLLGQPDGGGVEVFDFAGAEPAAVGAELAAVLNCGRRSARAGLLVCPLTVSACAELWARSAMEGGVGVGGAAGSDGEGYGLFSEGVAVSEVTSVGPHLTMENPPASIEAALSQTALAVMRLYCA